MRQIFSLAVAGGLLAGVAIPVASQPAPAPACSLSVGQSGWNDPAPLAALAAGSAENRPVLPPVRAMNIALKPTPDMRFLLPPGQPGTPASYAGIVYFTAPVRGTYRFLSSEDPWYDVIGVTGAPGAPGAGGMASPVARSHDRDCTPVTRKMIDYTLEPGEYALQIARTSTPEVVLLLLPLP